MTLSNQKNCGSDSLLRTGAQSKCSTTFLATSAGSAATTSDQLMDCSSAKVSAKCETLSDLVDKFWEIRVLLHPASMIVDKSPLRSSRVSGTGSSIRLDKPLYNLAHVNFTRPSYPMWLCCLGGDRFRCAILYFASRRMAGHAGSFWDALPAGAHHEGRRRKVDRV